MPLRVIHAAGRVCVHDLGRPGLASLGLASLGVPSGGAFDDLSHRAANRLVHNPDDAATLELAGETHLDADEFLHVAIAGLVRSVTLAGAVVPPWTRLTLAPGERLVIIPETRATIAVAGGIDVPLVLGSRDTCLSGAFGGLDGRALRPGDALPVGRARAQRAHAPPGVAEVARLEAVLRRRRLRATPSPLAERRYPAGVAALFKGSFVVAPASDRVGLRLAGSSLPPIDDGRMPSEPARPGMIQLPHAPPPGELLLLGPDAPTTGGYPVLACLAPADLPALAHAAPGTRLTFERVTLDEADTLRDEHRACLDALAPPRRCIDLNCDLGEEPAHAARDEALARVATSLNIACAGHAGDDASMARMVAAALASGAAIGAHPSYPDRANFGRVSMPMPPAEIERHVESQVRALAAIIARTPGTRLAHVKPHGALYHDASRDPAIALSIARAVRGALPDDPHVALVGMQGSPALAVWASEGFRVLAEAFADRAYDADGSLRPRSQPGALITDPTAAAFQALALARAGAATLCVHADSPNALSIARAVRLALERDGWSIK